MSKCLLLCWPALSICSLLASIWWPSVRSSITSRDCLAEASQYPLSFIFDYVLILWIKEIDHFIDQLQHSRTFCLHFSCISTLNWYLYSFFIFGSDTNIGNFLELIWCKTLSGCTKFHPRINKLLFCSEEYPLSSGPE